MCIIVYLFIAIKKILKRIMKKFKKIQNCHFRRASDANNSGGGKDLASPEPMTSPRMSNSSRPESVIDKLR